MTTSALKSQTIGAIRRFVSINTSRDGLKELLLEGGANAERVLRISLAAPMKSDGYISASVLLNTGFDTIYDDFARIEADGILLRMAAILARRNENHLKEGSLQDLEVGLSASGLSTSQIVNATMSIAVLETAATIAGTIQMDEVSALMAKGLRRLTTDRPGAITACTSAAESACRVALERLNIPLPSGKQLPDYLTALTQQTNLEALARLSGEDAKKVFTSLRGLAQNSYMAAHQLGDRHAHGDNTMHVSTLVSDLLISSCAIIAVVVAGALSRNELKKI